MIYFIQEGETGPIKIGYSSNPYSRLAAMQTSHAGQLHLIATMPGTSKKEKELHFFFDDLHIMGEWFSPDPFLIKCLCTPFVDRHKKHGEYAFTRHSQFNLTPIYQHKQSKQPNLKDIDIINTIKETDGNKAKAARMLGISRATLYRRLNN